MILVQMTSSKYPVPYWPSGEVVQATSPCVTIVVEGNISAGKSTLLKRLEESGSYEVSCAKSDSRSCSGPSMIRLVGYYHQSDLKYFIRLGFIRTYGKLARLRRL